MADRQYSEQKSISFSNKNNSMSQNQAFWSAEITEKICKILEGLTISKIFAAMANK
jgi:hypothetical protein